MASKKKWTNGDSARVMTSKYNKTVEELEDLQRKSSVIETNSEEIEQIRTQLQRKAENKSDVGLGSVDNTSDRDKPVSIPQAKAIELATREMITSEPSENYIEEDGMNFIFGIDVDDTKLIISI